MSSPFIESSEDLSETIADVGKKIYEIGRIYKLTTSSNTLIYIGSTSKTLSHRLGGHKSKYTSYLKGKYAYNTSFMLLANDTDVTIELIEEHKNISKNDLRKRERYHIEANDCVNMIIPTRTNAEYVIENKNKIALVKKAYRDAHQDLIKPYMKEYYETNKDIITAYKKEYRQFNIVDIKAKEKAFREAHKSEKAARDKRYNETNKEILAQKKKIYREANKEKLAAHKNEKILCDACKCTFTRGNKTKHERSIKHVTNNITYNISNSTVHITTEQADICSDPV